MKLAIADPPYLGQGAARYGHQHADAAAADDPAWHLALLGRLQSDYHGWVLFTHQAGLRLLLPHAEPDARVGAWVKPFHAWRSTRVVYAWEPVLYLIPRGRRRPDTGSLMPDYVSAPMTTATGTVGAKPAMVARWALDLLGATDDDQVDDLFPGSGAITAAIHQTVMPR